MRRLPLVLLALALPLAACKAKMDAPPERIDVPAPPSPDPGSVHFAVSGSDTLDVRAVGPRCSDVDGGVDFSAAGDGWRLTGWPPRKGQDADLRVTVGDHTYVWEPGEGTVAFHDKTVRFDAPMKRWKSTELVHLVGEVRCESLDAKVPIAKEVVALLGSSSSAEVRPFATYEFGRAKDARAISVVVSESSAPGIVEALRARLGKGWSAWQGTSRFVDEGHHDVEVVVGPVRGPADIIRIAHVDPVNYDLTTEDVVAKVRAWDEQYGVDVRQADVESVELAFIRLPDAAVPALAKEIYEFCPDSVDQGVGSLEALAAIIRAHKRIVLWWD
ncbi:MAG: DUF4253 domain-containing protein [Myxococcales bacterium]|nr:DUF4253 domain-containing protein [Myxococcales bacterium]